MLKRVEGLLFGKKTVLRCSFCKKPPEDVCRLIAGPSVYICDECVAICVDVVGQDRNESAEGRVWPFRSTRCALCRQPAANGEAIVVENRGLICAGCSREIEAAISRQKLQQ